MAAYPETSCVCNTTDKPKLVVFRVIDDGDRVLTTTDPLKALRKLQEVLDKHDISHAWVEEEDVQ